MQTFAQIIEKHKLTPASFTPMPALPAEPKRENPIITLSQLKPHHPSLIMAIDAAKSWGRQKRAGNDRISLVLVATEDKSNPTFCTGYGCGKTHIARAILWSGHTVSPVDGLPLAPAGVFMTADELIQSLDGQGGGMRSICPARLDRVTGEYTYAHCLVIDDIGTEKVIPFVSTHAQERERHNRYFEAVNYCYEKGISLVITGNLKLPAIEEVIGGRAWSRLLGMAPKGFMLDLTGVPDWRRKQGGRHE